MWNARVNRSFTKREILNIVKHSKHNMNILEITSIVTQVFSFGMYILVWPISSFFLSIKHSNRIFLHIQILKIISKFVTHAALQCYEKRTLH